jgi:hypothetical protein
LIKGEEWKSKKIDVTVLPQEEFNLNEDFKSMIRIGNILAEVILYMVWWSTSLEPL